MKNVEKLFIIAILGMAAILSGCSKDVPDGTQENVETLNDESAGMDNGTDNVEITEEIEDDAAEDTQIIGENTQIIEEDAEEENEQNITAEISGSCIDSDGGADYHTKGTITAESEGTKRTYTDYCRTGKFKDYVYEYHCVNGTVASENYDCANGCSDGKCYS